MRLFEDLCLNFSFFCDKVIFLWMRGIIVCILFLYFKSVKDDFFLGGGVVVELSIFILD